MSTASPEYAGFWIRAGASLIDTVLISCAIFPPLVAIYGWSYFAATAGFVAGTADVLISWVAPAIAVIAFWLWKQATPGKMLLSLRVVDADTGGTMSVLQSVVRYMGYFVSAIPLCLGIFWVAFDPKKQGWHDKLAGTVVIRSKNRESRPAEAEKA